MRILLAVPLLLLGACQVSKDDNSTTLSFNEDVAANAADDVGNAVEEAGGAIANSAEKAAGKVENEVGDVDVDLNVTRNKDEKNTNNQ
jgi:hypothetical protein